MAQRSSSRRPPEEESVLLEAFKTICKEAGIKVTHQRLEIFRLLARATDHPSAEDLFERVKQCVPTIARDTVYRTLATLERYGVLRKVQNDSRTRFDPNLALHHHFICTECKKIADFYWPVFDKMNPPSGKKPWGKIRSKHVELKGVCAVCHKGRKPGQ